MKKNLLLCLVSCAWIGLAAQSSLPMLPEYAAAYAKGTRSWDGKPGTGYFQNRSDYVIEAEIEPSTRLLTGHARITYHNNSPKTLNQIVLRTYMDIFRADTKRTLPVAATLFTPGVEISALSVNGTALTLNGSGAQVTRKETNRYVQLPTPLAPGQKAEIEVNWTFTIPADGQLRMGTYEKSTFFLAYWYPQVAVFDDVYGWDELQYSGMTEFYNDFGNFDVSISLPENYLAWSTGLLQNPEAVLADTYLDRYRKAWQSDQVVKIVSAEDYERNAQITQPNAKNTWHYKAEYVPDFAFAVSDTYLWDAASALVNGKRVLTDACYAASAKDFYEVAGFTKEIIEDLSNNMPGVAYPYPKMTIFHGVQGSGGMEYPMMVNNESSGSAEEAWDLAYHEIAHSYFPFYMGINERRFAWMDEGWATFFPVDPMARRWNNPNSFTWGLAMYERIAGEEMQVPLMTYSDDIKSFAYYPASYGHPATAYFMLREALGDSLFKVCLQTYMARWNGKHPGPYDFFFTFNEVSGQNLDWFWGPWFFEKRIPDMFLSDGKIKGKNLKVTVGNLNGLPMPIDLTVTFKNGTKEELHYPVSVWKDQISLRVEKSFDMPVKSVVLGGVNTPDKDRSNNKLK